MHLAITNEEGVVGDAGRNKGGRRAGAEAGRGRGKGESALDISQPALCIHTVPNTSAGGEGVLNDRLRSAAAV